MASTSSAQMQVTKGAATPTIADDDYHIMIVLALPHLLPLLLMLKQLPPWSFPSSFARV
jgi:hypothetical protein